MWGTGDLPLCTECERLNRLQNPHPEAPAFARTWMIGVIRIELQAKDPGAASIAFQELSS